MEYPPPSPGPHFPNVPGPPNSWIPGYPSRDPNVPWGPGGPPPNDCPWNPGSLPGGPPHNNPWRPGNSSGPPPYEPPTAPVYPSPDRPWGSGNFPGIPPIQSPWGPSYPSAGPPHQSPWRPVADADRTIVTTALQIAENINKKVVVVTEDTDVLVLVAALTPSDSEVFVLKPARRNKAEELYSSKSLDHLPSVLENILFLHAFTGCDTVSATFYQGKVKFFKTFQINPDLAIHARKFKEDVIEDGCQLLLAMYNGPMSFRKPNVPDQYKPSIIDMVE
ncbi:hypothetical protein NQ314_021513, partial [Rhamnusium bicolor]